MTLSDAYLPALRLRSEAARRTTAKAEAAGPVLSEVLRGEARATGRVHGRRFRDSVHP